MDRDGYEALTSEEKVWINVRTIIDSTENGGLISRLRQILCPNPVWN
jgi:hypothetical protein